MPSKACVPSTLCKCADCQNVCVEFNQRPWIMWCLDQLFESKHLNSSRASPSIPAWQLKTVTLAWNISTICISLFDLDFHYCKYWFLWPTGCCMGIRSQSYPKECLTDSTLSSCCKFDKTLESLYKYHKPGWSDNQRIDCNLQFGSNQYFTSINVSSLTCSHQSIFLCASSPLPRLLNANKIHCVRANAFQDLQNLSLLSLYDNKIQTLAKGTFASLRAIQTL